MTCNITSNLPAWWQKQYSIVQFQVESCQVWTLVKSKLKVKSKDLDLSNTKIKGTTPPLHHPTNNFSSNSRGLHSRETSLQSVSKGGLRHVRWKMWSNFFVIWNFLAIPRVLERELGWAELDGMASMTLTPAVSARQSSCLLEHFANKFAYQHHGGKLKIWFSYKIPFICHIPDKNQSTG